MLRIKQDLHSGIFLLFSSLVVYLILIPNFVELSEISSLSPRFFPKLATIIMGILSLYMTVNSWRKLKELKAKTVEPVASANPEQTANRNWQSKYCPFVVIALMLAFCTGFEHIGFLWVTPIVTAGLMYIFGERSLKLIIITCAIVTTVLFLLFVKGLNVPLT